jgi:hypothetical protein
MSVESCGGISASSPVEGWELHAFCTVFGPVLSVVAGVSRVLYAFSPFVRTMRCFRWCADVVALVDVVPGPRPYRGSVQVARSCFSLAAAFQRGAADAAWCELGEAAGLPYRSGCMGWSGVEEAVKGGWRPYISLKRRCLCV